MVTWLFLWAFAIGFARCLLLDIDYDDIGGQIGIFGSFDGLTYYNDRNSYNLAVPPVGANSYNLNGTFEFVNQTQAPVTQVYRLETHTLLTIQDGVPILYDVVTGGSSRLQGWRTRVTGLVETVHLNSSQLFLGGNLTVDGITHGLAVYDLSQRRIIDSPFGGFNENASVNAIVQMEDSLIFGGSFYSLNNYTDNSTTANNITVVNPEQQVSLRHASISGDGSGGMVCADSSGWTLPEGNVGEWNAELPVAVNPSKMRIFNGEQDAVRVFRVMTYPSDSIMNLTYVEPGSNEIRFCDAWCPLLNNISSYDAYTTNYTNEETVPLGYSSDYQEFAFHNSLSVSRISLQVLSFYGTRAELSGFQLFQNEIVAYANDTLNDPTCSDTEAYSYSSYLEHQSPWQSAEEGYIYTSVNITDSVPIDLGISFHPNISYSGNYTVNLYTPGCLNDGTCSERGIVNVTVFDGYDDIKATRLIYQTNEYDKYDTLFSGHLDVNEEEQSGPYVEMALYSAISYSSDSLVLVADRVSVIVDGIDESYFQNETKSDDISLNGLFEYLPQNASYAVGNSSINRLGNETLPLNATVNGLALIDGELLIGGDFNSSENVVSASRFFPLENSTIVSDNNQLYLYNGTWYSLDDADLSPETMASFTLGEQNYLVFDGLLPSVKVWEWENDVVSGSWSNTTNLNVSAVMEKSVFGSVRVVDLSANNSAIAGSQLETAPHSSGTIQASLYVNNSLQVIGGDELTFINGNSSHSVEIDGYVTSLLSYRDSLFVGTAQGRGVEIYDMATNAFETSPSPLQPDNSVVSTLSFNDNHQILAVGGNFTSAGSLSCAGLCLYAFDSQRWISPSQSIFGEVYFAKFFSNSELLMSGDFTVDGEHTYFAVYNFDSREITLQPSLNSNAPGPVKKFILVDNNVNGRILAFGEDFVSFHSGSSGSSWSSIDQGLNLSQSELLDMTLVPVSASIGNQTIVDSGDALLLSGSLNLGGNGTVGAALFNGESWFPYLIASDNGTINSVMVYRTAQSLGDVTTAPSYMGRGGVVFASMAVALATSLLLGGLLVALRKASDKRNGYNRPLQSRVEESEMMKTVPPDQLISGMDYAKYAQ